MALNRFFPIYKALPIWLQSVACTLYGYNFVRRTYCRRYHEIYTKLLESEWWSSSQIESFQDEQVKDLVLDAYRDVQYYRELMDGLKLVPNDIKCVADLQKLPILQKEDIRNNIQKFVSRKSDSKKLLFRHTSGTTGKSLHLYVNKETDLTQWAVWWRHRNRFGMKIDSLHVYFSANLFVPAEQEYPPFWRIVEPMKQIIMNMHHFTAKKIKPIVDFLNQNYFEFFTAFPSIVHIFAITAYEAGLRLANPPRVIFMGAENTLDFQRRFLDDFFGSQIVEHYGFSEGCGNASVCEHGRYHEDFELGLLECVDPQSLPGGQTRGKIVATGFKCHEFPFIRYEVGDTGIWEAPSVVCQCGRQSRTLVDIEGRQDEYVITPEGRRLMRFDFLFKDAQNCYEAQVVQAELGKIKIFIVRRPGYSSKDERQILREVRKWISETIEVEFIYVSEITREPSGKFRAVKSLLNLQHNPVIPDNCALHF